MIKELKPLEALERIKRTIQQLDYGFISKEDCEDFKIIENSLKALEVIKKKGVNVWLFHCGYNLIDYNNALKKYAGYYERELTQEEHDLLKEALV